MVPARGVARHARALALGLALVAAQPVAALAAEVAVTLVPTLTVNENAGKPRFSHLRFACISAC